MPNHKYELFFTDAVRDAIYDLNEKYGIAIDPLLPLAQALKKKNSTPIIFEIAQQMIDRKGPFQEIIATIKREFELPNEKAKELAHEIKDKIVVLAEEAEPEENEDRAEIESPAETRDYSRELAEHIKEGQAKPGPQLQPRPTIPKPPAPTPPASAEGSGEAKEEPKKVKTVIPPEINKINPGDTYREPIE